MIYEIHKGFDSPESSGEPKAAALLFGLAKASDPFAGVTRAGRCSRRGGIGLDGIGLVDDLRNDPDPVLGDFRASFHS